MDRIIFGSPEAAAILEKDKPLRAEAAREAAIDEARRRGRIETFGVTIESDRSITVQAYSAEEAEEIVYKEHLRLDERIVAVDRE